MKNKELLLLIADSMASLAEGIKALAGEEADTETEVKVEAESKVEEKAVAETKAEAKKEPEPGKKYSMEDVRAALAEKSGAGFTAEVRTLLEKHGGAKLSKIPESEYAAIMEEVKEIG